jgi:hypothetical protein
MEIKKFNSYINENLEEKDFFDKLKEDFDIIDAVKHILNRTFESLDNKLYNVKNSNDFEQTLFDNIKIYDTDVVDFDLEKQIDICIYKEKIDGSGCPACTWDDLAGIIYNNSVDGLQYLADEIIRENFINDFNDFMKDNNLEYNNISSKEQFGYAAPSKVIPLEKGDVSQYRKLDNEYDVDEYRYENEFFNIEIYIKKEL